MGADDDVKILQRLIILITQRTGLFVRHRFTVSHTQTLNTLPNEKSPLNI